MMPPFQDASVRSQLIDLALEFIRTARRLPGVLRIAMIGSLPTNKSAPKDADILLAVGDDADLAPIASAARRLQGRALSIGRGGEVFLADAHGNYIGRICPWKQCGPGIRATCDALHCSRRLYLHDDFAEIRLAKRVIAGPRVEIWPDFVERLPIADDLRAALMAEITTA